MMRTHVDPLVFFPSQPAKSLERLGFRLGAVGTHASRTIMLSELDAMLAAAPCSALRAEYAAAIIEDNCLQKRTASTRRISNQRLGELYALDPLVALFRVVRKLWDIDPAARPQLAMLAALARDPLLRTSAAPVLTQPEGTEIQRAPIRDALRCCVGDRMNDDTVDKVVRNVLSSWSQSGHLTGRTFKRRTLVKASTTALSFALWLGRVAGLRGRDLLQCGWVAALDCTASSARGLAMDAKRCGFIDFRTVNDVVEIGVDRLDPGIGRPQPHGAT